MARELRHRYASMADVAADLRAIRAGEAPRGPRGDVRRVRKLGVVGASFLGCLVVIGLAIAFRQSDGPRVSGSGTEVRHAGGQLTAPSPPAIGPSISDESPDGGGVPASPSALGPATSEGPPEGVVDHSLQRAQDPPVTIRDGFDDGVLDASMWVTAGRRACPHDPGGGSWQWAFQETDGYMEARTWGPSSGASCWGEASVRTAYDFNDGQRWLIDFTWETLVAPARHVDWFGIQVTDGGLPSSANLFWMENENPAGTVTLGIAGDDRHIWNSKTVARLPESPFGVSDWSMLIHPEGTAELYLKPGAQGPPYAQRPLDSSHPWHWRLVAIDGTSGGYPRGDNAIRLHKFSADAIR